MAPLLLLIVGIGGAWVGYLTMLEPYQPFFVAIALIALFFAGRRIWRPANQCAPGDVCAVPRVRRTYKLLFVVVAVLLLIAVALPYAGALFY